MKTLLPRPSTRNGKAALVWRYALAPACIGAAILLHVSPAGALLHPMGAFILAVIAAAWFGGAGPGVLAGFLAAIAAPHLITAAYPLSVAYPLLAGFFDLPRFITLGLTGAAVGWGTDSYRRAQATLREKLETAVEERTARVSESEARFRSLTELSSDFYWETDAEHRYLAIELGWGYSGVRNNAAKLGRARWEIPYASPDEAAWAAHRAAIAARERFVAFRFSRIEEGEQRFYEHSGEPRYDARGNFLGYRGVGRDVTARKRDEEALRESQQRYERAIAASNAGLWDWDVVTDTFHVSPRFLEIGGLPPDTVFSGREDFMRRGPLHPEDRAKWQQAARQLFAGRDSRLAMDARMTVHGEARWCHLNGICFRDAAGRVVRWTGSVTDVTDRKRAEEALRQSEERYARVMAAAEAGFWDWDVVQDKYYVSPRLLEMAGLPPGTTIAGRADFQARVPLHPEDLKNWQEAIKALFASGGSRLSTEVRVVLGGQTRWYRLDGMCFRDAAGRVVRWTGSSIDITSQKLVEEALRASEARKSAMFETALDCIITIDHEGRVVEFNPAAERTFGYPRAEALGKELAELIIPLRLRADHRKGLARYLKGGAAPVLGRRTEMPAVRADGTEFPVELTVTRIETESAPLFTAYLRDITESKRAEAALRASEERYALAMEAAGDGHTDWNLVTGEFYISPRLLGILGHAPGTTFADRADWVRRFPFHPEDRPRWEAAAAAHFAGREAKFRMDLRIVVNGETRWVAFTFIATRDAAGNPVRWTGSIADINDAKLAAEALRESQERYALAVAGSDDGVWDVDFAARRVFISARARELVGMPPGPDIISLDEFVSALPIHPEDAPRRVAALQAHLEGRAPAYVGEFRLRHADGVYRWRRLHGLCLRDAEGKPHRMAGSISDVDARKRAEVTLAESEAQFRSLTELSADFFWETDAAHRCTVMEFGSAYRGSRALGAKLGKTRWEVPPASPGEAEWSAHRAEIAARRRFVNFGFSRIENGEERFYEESGEPRYDAQGSFLGYRGVGRDVTERKRAEEALRRSEARYALAMEVAEEGHWDWNVRTDEIFASAQARRVVGLPEGEYRTRGEMTALIRYYQEDGPRVAAQWREALAGTGTEHEFEYRVLRGEEARWIRSRWKVFRDAGGAALRVVGIVADITQSKQAVDTLRASESRFRALTELSSDAYWVQDENLRFLPTGSKVDLAGFPSDSHIGKTRSELSDATPLTGSWADHEAVLAARKPFRDFEYRRPAPDGSVRYLSISGAPIFDDHGVFRGYQGVGRDITGRKRGEEEVRASEARFRRMTELSADTYWEQDENFRYTRTGSGTDIAGYVTDVNQGKTRWEMTGEPTPLSSSWEEHRAVLAAHQPFRDFEYRRLRPDGTMGYYSASGAPMFDAEGRFRGYQGVARDITEFRRVEEELRESNARFRVLTDLSSDWYWQQDENLRFTYLSRQGSAGLPTDAALGKARWEFEHIKPLSGSWAEHRALLAAREPFRDLELSASAPDGSVSYISISGAPIFDERGEFKGYQGTGRNITERKGIEEALRQSEERYALAVAGSNEGIFDWDLISDRVYVSYRAQELFGLPRGELWRPRRDWRHILTFHPEDARRLHDHIKEHIEGGTPTYDVEFRIVLPGGEVRWFRQRGVGLRDASGKAYRVVGSIGDVTEQHKAGEELRRLERQLRLAQRLEAMGTLAGGIAHDFNNILGAILGYGEMALRDAPKGGRLARDLGSIVVAGERGRALVDRVLAFSRSAVGERVPVHVEKVVRETLELLTPKLPANVALRAELRAGRAAMLGDPTHVHQVVTNLATNAIHAMPAGGTLRVSLRAARLDAPRTPTLGVMPAGDYLVLEVADSGSGIAPEIMDRIFDPFFTTKEVGTGTGLGLSLVHGIVAELGGAIDVASTPGAGSTFSVFLPRAGEAADSFREEEPELPRGDGERVLVVDDEEPLVRLATRTLEELGYAPVGFTSSAAALAAFRADPQRFDAVITDERMPGMSGSSLIREVRGIRDRIPVVLMSGFVGGAVARAAREAGAEEVLKKPLSARDLAASLARVLHP